ncbi:centromere protein K-like [Styela clava]
MASSLEESETQLFDMCHQLAEKLNSLKTEVQNISLSQTAPKSAEDIAKQNLRILGNEEITLKAREPFKVINNSLLVATNFDKDLENTIKESDETLEMLQKSVLAMEAKLEDKSSVMIEQRQISQGIQNKLKQMSEKHKSIGQTDEQFTEEYLEQLTMKRITYTKGRKKFQQKMNGFLDQWFPSSTNSKKNRETYKSLNFLVKKLINLSIQTPENPYLEITDDFWPPHIELLLRYNICCRHQKNPSLVKLLYTGI